MFASNIPAFIQASRKVLHLELGRSQADLVKTLVRLGKTHGCFEKYWGKHVHPTETLDARASWQEMTVLSDISHDHTSYICAARSDFLRGVSRLDKKVIVMDGDVVKGTMTLRQVLLSCVKTRDGRSVFAEIHQRGSEDPMVVVPNEAEVESLLLRLNHQLPAFLLHYLPAKTDMPMDFVVSLLNKACDPKLFNEAFQCTWDAETWVITRPGDEVEKRKEAERTKDKWYVNIVSSHLAVNQSPTRPHNAPQALYDLDAEKSVTTIHTKKPSKQNPPKPTLRSERDGDSTDSNASMDSASENAPSKSFSRIGFRADTETEINLASDTSDSESEGVSIDDNGNSAPRERGKGG